MTPIEKNVIVVDEQGNEYGATYPKRAKGLVKKGRARFVEENKICLACPPGLFLEDNKMTDNSDKKAETVQNAKDAAAEAIRWQNEFEQEYSRLSDTSVSNENNLSSMGIFEQLTVLQKQLTENSQTSFERLSEAIAPALSSDGIEEESRELISDLIKAFRAREVTLLNILSIYKQMYEDIQKENSKKAEIQMASAAFDNILDQIRLSDISGDDRYAALTYVADKIAETVSSFS